MVGIASSVRGTGTSGYVQLNLSQKRDHSDKHDSYRARQQAKRQRQLKDEAEMTEKTKKQARKNNDRNKLRDIEVKCTELRDELEDLSEDEEIIEKKISELRSRLINSLDQSCDLEKINTNGDSEIKTSTESNPKLDDKSCSISPKIDFEPTNPKTTLFQYKPRYKK